MQATAPWSTFPLDNSRNHQPKPITQELQTPSVSAPIFVNKQNNKGEQSNENRFIRHITKEESHRF
ncbi:hypothetical protein LBSG162_15340 [Lentilactobacillus buchneri subsp. silagei]|nr:hypothetical protein LBSG162_15340 [Lentilactobacillus buchneri subsp. silagei]GED93497.1 hypothetical protein LBSP_00570 [Lentilactobacillus buchneri subsp. silagei]